MAKLILQNVRLAFPQLFKADDKFGKYGTQLIIEKGSANAKKIDDAIEQAAKEKWGAKAETTLKAIKAGGKICFTDGDAKADYEGFEGNMSLSTGNSARPTVVNKDKTPLTEADGVIYAGCYVNAIVDIWAQDNSYGKRINASLRGVQFAKDGDQFGGGGVAKDSDFEDISEGADAEDFV